MTNKNIDGVSIPMTPAEQAEHNAKQTAWKETGFKALKLSSIKNIRNKKLQETDYLANSDMTMPDNIKTWRQSLRDIPQDNTTEEQYDLLLAKDENKQLTHEIWSKPE